ncbi:sulfite oxidase heme-binding subunit YedZ [Bermanella sp. R86510]|uniref:sulfite oxidase heme-binding subunit YedZ n=1 Tax=unclassified Bermanella TaxID=2627862 RepID=UPI0037CC1519
MPVFSANPKQKAYLSAAVWLFVFIPLISLLYGIYEVQVAGNLFYYGPEPGKAVVHMLGQWAIGLLLLVVSINPLNDWLGVKLRPYSRRLGLAAFAYAALHIASYFIFIQGLVLQELWQDLQKRPYIIVGAIAWLLLLPLAITSTKSWMRRLKRNWKRLHMLVYPSIILVLIHLWWQVKADAWLAVLCSVIFAIVLVEKYRRSRLA